MATTFAGISKSKNKLTYSCDVGPGYNKMDAPGNGLLLYPYENQPKYY